MEDLKPDKALLDQSIEASNNQQCNQIQSSVNSNGSAAGNVVRVKSEPLDEEEMSGVCVQDVHDSSNLNAAEPLFNLASIKIESPFPFVTDTCTTSLAPSTSNYIQSFQDIPGPSTPSDNMMKLLEMDNLMKASNLLRDMAEQSEPGTSSNAAPTPGPSVIETEQKQLREQSSRSLFHIDTSQIQGAASIEQTSDLAGLGVSVYNQDEFEAGVMQQVDQAINLEEETAAKQRAQKEMKAVITDVRSCKQDISRMDRLIQAVKLPSAKDFAKKEAHRKMLSIKTQRENKVKQLKNLRAKQRTLMAKINGSIEGLELSDDEEDAMGAPDEGDAGILKGLLQAGATMSTQETEQERMIRLGMMTPFGTTMSFADTSSRRASQPRQMTDFEKMMLAKDDVDLNKHKESTKATKMAKKRRLEREKQYLTKKKNEAVLAKKKKTAKESVPDKPSSKGKSKKGNMSSGQKSRKKTSTSDDNTFEDGTFFAYKPVRSESSDLSKRGAKRKMGYSKDLKPNWGSDEEGMNDEDAYDVSEEDSDEYRPDERELMSDEEDGDYVPDVAAPKGRVKGRDKKRNFAEDIDDGTITSLDDLKAAYGVKPKKSKHFTIGIKKKDDSTQDQYFKRLRENKKKRLLRQQQRIERGEIDSDSEEEEDMEFEGGLNIPGNIWTKLYRYQKTGVKWMWELHQQQCGGVVGDEMGLGKTIQMIAFLAGLKKSKLRSRGTRYTGLGPVIIVCPTTVMHQWVREFNKWAPDFRVAILHDSGAHTGTRSALVKDIALSHAVLVTSYSSVRLRQDILLKHDWHYVILDEGHKIRNPDARVTLACKQFRTPHRLILSGSPMQNNLRELWSLFDFVFPGKLGTLPVFMEKFSVPITIGGYANASSVQVQTAYKCACVLRDTINPYLLRRMKSDVKSCLQLPEKNEQVLFCRLTDEQTALYKEYLEGKECQMILNRQYQVFAGLIKLRKLCNHPDLVSGGPRLLISEMAEDDASLPEHLHYGYWKRSGKMLVVESLLKLWKEQGQRVLLFSQSKQMLDIFESFVKEKYTYMRMDGGTPISSRQTLINRFNYDASIFLFLLTTRVGGLGVNLTGANRVVIFDPDWNPSTDTQARERAWRIGQKKQVTIYRLLTSGTIEEKIYHRQIFKTFLSNRVLKDPRQRRFFKSNDLFELFSLGSTVDSHGTETSAIFAGTGSDVHVKTNVIRPPSVSRDSKQQTGIQQRARVQGAKDGHPARTHPKAKASKVKRSSGIQTNGSDQERDDRTTTPNNVKGSKVRRLSSSVVTKLSSEECDEVQVVDASKDDEVKRAMSQVPHVEAMTSESGRLSSDTPSQPSEQKGDDIHSIKTNKEGTSASNLPKNSMSAIFKDSDEIVHVVRNNDDDEDVNNTKRTVLEIPKETSSTPQGSSSALTSPDVNATLAKRARQIARKLGKEDGASSPTSSKDSISNVASPDVKASLAERARQIASQFSTKPKEGGSTTVGQHHSPVKSHCEKTMNGQDRDDYSKTNNKSHSGIKVSETRAKKKKKKKKKTRDATIDGHQITNLAKHSAYKGIGADEEKDKKANEQADDYVLHRLFKKSGVHSALQHDNIMNSANPDYLLVENEADRVAKEAVKALKQSRQRCMTAASGVPTWTGASGHSGAPPGIKKPRFGQKSNSRIATKTVKTTPLAVAASNNHLKGRFSKKKQLFQGGDGVGTEDSPSSSSGTASPALPASNDLLAKMRARNHVVLDNNSEDDDNPAATSAGSGQVTDELLKDIHQFVSFQGEVDGQAKTSELLAKFKGRLPSNSTALFKAMLTKICDFHRKTSGEGVWKLKSDFR